MPLYEYRCLDCKKRSTVLVLSLANQAPAACSHCASARVERIMSRFASPKSEEARLDASLDLNNLAGLDENDPRSMARFMKNMGEEMGEDMGEDVDAMMESGGDDAASMDESDSL